MAAITRGNTKRLEILPVKIIKKNSNTYTFTSTHKVSLKNYNLEPPKKMMGMVNVNDAVTIELALNVKYRKL